MNLFEGNFTLTDRLGYIKITDEVQSDLATNEFSSNLYDGETYYWNLPPRFLNNQVKSYGGTLNFTIRNEGSGEVVPDQDVILIGNGVTLFWRRQNQKEEVIIKAYFKIKYKIL